MSIRKTFGMTLLALSMTSIPILANATLTITNNTDKDSTAFLNGEFCSNTLQGGITSAHSTNVIPDLVISFACMFHSSDCTADIYMTDDCGGAGSKSAAPVIGTVVFDTTLGITKITPISDQYILTGAGFTFQIDPKA